MAEADIDDLIEIIGKEGNVEEIPKVIPMMPVRGCGGLYGYAASLVCWAGKVH